MSRCFTAVDLFCGCGGLTLGFKMANRRGATFKVLAAIDNWRRAADTYKANHPEVAVINDDIRTKAVVQKLKEHTGGHADIIIGGPPCEAFSLAGKRDPNDPRARLFYEYVNVVGNLRPYLFVMENVRGILTMISLREDIPDNEKSNVLETLREVLDLRSVGKTRKAAPQYILRNNQIANPELRNKIDNLKKRLTRVPESIVQAFGRVGYDVQWKLLNAADYGVPQERMRVIFIGARRGLGLRVRFPEPTHAKEPTLQIGGGKLMKWRTLRDAIGDLGPLRRRIGDEVFEGGFTSIYMSRNRVMDWGRPSYTILASARHVLLHPNSPKMVKVATDKMQFKGKGTPRRLSIRECARIQTFPDSYKFFGNVVDKYMLIGDAVPPLLAMRVAREVLSCLVEANSRPSDSTPG